MNSGAAHTFSLTGAAWSEKAKLAPADLQANDYFGSSVSLVGTYALIGSIGDDDGGRDSGSVYLYKGGIDEIGNIISWTAKMKLTASDSAPYANFGKSVSLNDGYALIGASGDDDNGSGSGSAYIYPLYLGVNGSASPELIEKGGSSILSWTSVFADSCNIESGVGLVGLNGSVVLSPTETTTYKITAVNSEGSVSENVTVTVVDPAVQPSVNISASQTAIGYNDSSTLSWSSYNAMYCIIEPGIGIVPISGSLTVSPTQDTTYTIRAINSGSESTASVTVNVICYNPAITVDAEPASIELGESVTITWSTTYADYCEIQPNIGRVGASGSISITPEDSTTFILTATGHCGTSVYNIPIHVIGPTSIQVTYPDSVNEHADQTCKIRWTDTGPNIDAAISLYYDTDNAGADGTLIVSGLSETPDGDMYDSYLWNTGGMREGTCYIYAVLEDGVNSPLIDYSDGPINIIHSTPDKLKVSGNNFYRLGSSVDISGDYAVANDSQYLGYIFKRDGAVWVEQSPLIPSALEEDGYNYNSVAIDGDYAIAGYFFGNNQYGTNSGVAYIFMRQGDQWIEQAKLVAGDGQSGDNFGCSVSINGDYAIIGAKRADNAETGYVGTGSAYIFKREGNTWTEQAKLLADDGSWNDFFGYSVSISEGYAVVGANEDDKTDNNGPWVSGSAYVFKKEGEAWIQQAKLTASDAGSWERFGSSVSIDGDHVIIGAPQNYNSGLYSGAAYVFSLINNVWTQTAKLTPLDPGRGKSFGISVDIKGNQAVIGADYCYGSGSQAAYLFKDDGDNWNQIKKLEREDSWNSFGNSVAISENYALVGAYGDGYTGHEAGAVYFYPLVSVSITAEPNIIQPDESSTLTWSSLSVDSCTIEPGIGTVGPNGSVSVSPTETTTYTITASVDGNTVTDHVTVLVQQVYPLPTVNINSSSSTINIGDSCTLTWSTTGATSCIVDNGVGNVEVNGSATVTPSATTTYAITATGPGGTATASATVTVNYPAPTVTISAEPQTINTGGSSVLTWSSQYATSCTIEPGIGTVGSNGSITVTPSGTTAYTITASNPSGTETANVTVEVISVQPSVDITVAPAIILAGESSSLIWSSTYASECFIDHGIGNVSLNGSISVSPSETTTYTITATNNSGTTADTATVSVTAPPAIMGVIIDDATSEPIGGVVVSITDSEKTQACTAGTDGVFLIGNITPGTITINLEKAGYVSRLIPYSISQGQTIDISIAMQKQVAGATLRGTVADGATGQLIQGATITVTDAEKNQTIQTLSDGSYSIGGISLGSVEVTAGYPGYFTETIQITLTDNVIYDYNFTLYSESALATVNGTILNAKTLLPEPGVAISVNNATISAVSLDDGSFILSNVPMGEQTFKVLKENFADTTFTANIDEDPYQLDLVFPNVTGVAYPAQIDENITGYIYDGLSGQSIANAIVKVSGTSVQTVSGADGKYVLTGLPQSNICLIAMASDHRAVYMYPTVVPNASGQFDFTLPPTTKGIVTGTVTDEDTGKPIRFVSVGFEGSLLSASTEADGTYKLVSVPSGEYNFKAVQPEYIEKESSLITVGDGATSTLNFTLKHKPVTGSLEGVITDNGTTAPVSNAILSVEGITITGSTDAAGHYMLSNLPAGLVNITITATGYPTTTRTTAVTADIDFPTPTITTANFELDPSDPKPPDSVSELIYAADGGTIETPDKSFMMVIPPNALSGDAIVTLMSPTTGPNVNPGDELALDSDLGISGIKALGKMIQVVIEPAIEGDTIPIINSLIVVSGRYSQSEADEFNIAESSIFPYYWDSTCWTAMRVKPHELAVDTINNLPVATLDFTTTEDGYPIIAKLGTKKPVMLASIDDRIPNFNTAKIFGFIFAGIVVSTIADSDSNVLIYDTSYENKLEIAENNTDAKRIPNKNALPLLIIHGWDPWSILLNTGHVDPNDQNEKNRYYYLIMDLVNATNGVYRPIFVTHNSRASVFSIANDLANKLNFHSIKGKPGLGKNPGEFPYMDTFGYSMGGLITRAYQANTGYAHNQILTATPNHGSFKFLDCFKLTGIDDLFDIEKIWSEGTADLLAYNDQSLFALFSGNPRLYLLNKNPDSMPTGDMSLIAGTDSSKLAGFLLDHPNDSIVPESSVYCRTSDPNDGLASLLSVNANARKYEYDSPFNHLDFGGVNYRISNTSNIDIDYSITIENAITHGLSDWIVAKRINDPVQKIYPTPPYYLMSVQKQIRVEYNAFARNKIDEGSSDTRTSRDIDRVTWVIYGMDAKGQWHIGGEMVDHEGNILHAIPVSGNSKDKIPLVIDANELYAEDEQIVYVIFEVVPLKPGQKEVAKQPSGSFGLPE